MFKTRIISLVCLCLILFTTHAFSETPKASQPYESAMISARSAIWQDINSGKCGSATVAITVNGQVVYAEGFGMADREKSIPVDMSTLFNIGSISKVYVAAAIMLLVDDGKVSLDKPVTDYLPEFKMADARYKNITVRMTLNHVSGIPGTEGSNSFGFRYDDNVKQETLNTLARAHLKHAPGAMAVYCNDAFTLAEMIVERVSGKKYIPFLQERIFARLGLQNTNTGVGEIKDKRIASYYDPKTGKRHPPETLSVLGAGGLSATAIDVCRFADAFAADNKLFKKASLAEMKKAQPSAFWGKLRHPEISFGLGWDFTGLPRYDAAGVQILGKSGGTGNYSSMVFTVPDKRISVTVIATGPHSNAMKTALNVMDAVLVEKQIISEEKKTVMIPPEAQPLPKDYASFNGYYATGGKMVQIVFDAAKNNATLYTFKQKEKIPATPLIYNNGYYFDAEANRFYFAHVGGEGYLVSSLPAFGIDAIAMQKVKPLEKPQNLKTNFDGKVWLRRNASPFDAIICVDSYFEKSWLFTDLPGYVIFQGVKRVDSPVSAGMPFDAIRDQTELTLFDKNGTLWAWISDLLYSPAAGATIMKAGANPAKIGQEGYNEWLVNEEDMVLSFTKPEHGRIVVFSPDDTVIYDSAIDSGEVFATRGSYTTAAGFANDTFTIGARSATPKK